MRTLAFTVLGDPKPQGSKRAFVVKGKAVLTESAGAPLRTWRQDIVAAAQENLNGDGPFEGAVYVTLRFHLRRPKKPKHRLPIVRPDVDKLGRACADALQTAGVVWDDSQIVSLILDKLYAENAPKVEVLVSEVV